MFEEGTFGELTDGDHFRSQLPPPQKVLLPQTVQRTKYIQNKTYFPNIVQ